MRVALGLLVVSAAACGGKNAEECKREAGALSELLVAAAIEAPTQFYVGDMKLVERTDIPATGVQHAPTVEVTRNGVQFQGQRVSTAELTRRLEVAAAKIKEDIELGRVPMREPAKLDPRRVYLQIDAAAPATEVVSVFEAMTRSQLNAVGFVFAVPPSVKTPPRSSLDPTLEKLFASNVDNKATELAKLISAEVEQCPSMTKVFGAVAAIEGDNKALLIAEGVKEALPECGCRVDIPRLRSALFWTISGPHTTRPLLLDPDAPPKDIAVGPTETWADLSTHLEPTTKNVRFVLR
jgi:hypothetical protein